MWELILYIILGLISTVVLTALLIFYLISKVYNEMEDFSITFDTDEMGNGLL